MHWKSAWPVCLHNKYLKEDDCFILKLCSFLYKLFVNDKEFTLAECKCFQMQTIFIFFLLSLTACTHVLNVNRINNNKKNMHLCDCFVIISWMPTPTAFFISSSQVLWLCSWSGNMKSWKDPWVLLSNILHSLSRITKS